MIGVPVVKLKKMIIKYRFGKYTVCSNFTIHNSVITKGNDILSANYWATLVVRCTRSSVGYSSYTTFYLSFSWSSVPGRGWTTQCILVIFEIVRFNWNLLKYFSNYWKLRRDIVEFSSHVRHFVLPCDKCNSASDWSIENASNFRCY